MNNLYYGRIRRWIQNFIAEARRQFKVAVISFIHFDVVYFCPDVLVCRTYIV